MENLVAMSAAALLIAACSDSGDAERTDAAQLDKEIDPVTETKSYADQRADLYRKAQEEMKAREAVRKEAATPTHKGSLMWGEETITFDQVICVPGLKESAIASDRKKRAGYPKVVIGWSEAAASGGAVMNSVSVDFDDGDTRALWLLATGDVQKIDNGYTAEGTLRGKRMIEQADGTRVSEPLDGGGLKPFSIKLQCR